MKPFLPLLTLTILLGCQKTPRPQPITYMPMRMTQFTAASAPLPLEIAPSPPQNLRVVVSGVTSPIYLTVTSGSNNPFGHEHLGWAAYWFRPDTNTWIPEVSTNGVDWTFAGNQWCELGSRDFRVSGQPFFGWSYTETATNWTPIWMVRIRRL